MKKIIFLFLFIFSVSFSLTNTNNTTLYENNTEIGELYTATFSNKKEASLKLEREKKYLMEKENFAYLKDLNDKGTAFSADYQTPIDHTISYKAFCGDKYISVYGNIEYSEQLLKTFLDETKKLGCNFQIKNEK